VRLWAVFEHRQRSRRRYPTAVAASASDDAVLMQARNRSGLQAEASRQALRGCARRAWRRRGTPTVAPRDEPRCWRAGTRCPEGSCLAFEPDRLIPSHVGPAAGGGPRVRIRLPPAESRVRTQFRGTQPGAGTKEDTASCREFSRDMRRRGLPDPPLRATGYGPAPACKTNIARARELMAAPIPEVYPPGSARHSRSAHHDRLSPAVPFAAAGA
jgi:hypothetical protein